MCIIVSMCCDLYRENVMASASPYTVKDNAELNAVVEEHFTHRFRTGYRVFEGYTLPEYYEQFRQEIEELEVYDDDVWVTSFPKTGSTWAREMVWVIANNLDFEGAKVLLPCRYPYLEFCAMFDPRNIEETDQRLPAICDSIQIVKNATRPRFIKTHLPWELLPKQIRNFEKRPKIVHIGRNPKDTCVSYFHHCSMNEGYTGTFDDFWQLFLANKISYTPYWDCVFSYWNKRFYENILFITYEDMKRDMISVIKRTSLFLGKNFNESEMQQLREHLSYENMKQLKSQFEPIVEFLKRHKLCTGNTGFFLRAGLIGNYRAQMCADVIDIFDKWAQENTKNSDLNFDISKYLLVRRTSL